MHLQAAQLLFALLLLAQQQPGTVDDLHKAAKAGDLQRVRALLEQALPVNHRDLLGSTPLHDAAWNGDPAVVSLLLDRGAEIDAKHMEAGSTPLHYAVTTNHGEVVRILLDRGAKVNATYRSSSTALHIASSRGFLKIAEMLIAKGADVNARDASGATPLDEAAWRGYYEMARLLIAKGANAKAHNKETGVTPLHEAASKGHVEVIKVLLESGAEMNAVDGSGATPLDEAIRFRHALAADLLMQRGAKMSGGGNTGARAMQEAVMRGNIAVVEMLLRRDPEMRNSKHDGFTPLHAAAIKGQVEIAALLLSQNADVNALSSTGGTPLHDAALGGQCPVAELLLAKGANVNAVDQESAATPLHHAASWGRAPMVILLLEKGADPKIRNRAGKTALDLAKEAGQDEVVAILSKRKLSEHAFVILLLLSAAVCCKAQSLEEFAKDHLPAAMELAHPPVAGTFGPVGRHIVLLYRPAGERSEFKGTVYLGSERPHELPPMALIGTSFKIEVKAVFFDNAAGGPDPELLVLYAYHPSDADNRYACLVYQWRGDHFERAPDAERKVAGLNSVSEVRQRLRRAIPTLRKPASKNP